MSEMGPFSEGFAACGEDLSHHRDELGVVILCEDPYGLAQSCKISEEEEQEDELGQHAESSGRVCEVDQKEVIFSSVYSESDENPVSEKSATYRIAPSRFNTSENAKLKGLKSLLDVCPGERDALLLEKLDRCGVLFDFQNTLSDKESKDMKRSDLMDILCYLSSNRNIVPADVCGGVISMIKKNLMVPLCPPSFVTTESPDVYEVISIPEPAWCHLELVYKIAISLMDNPYIDADAVSKHIDKGFIVQVFDLLSSEDPCEREALKRFIHKMYLSLTNLRPTIRNIMNNALLQVIYEDRRHNGICKILEIVASVVCDLSAPLGAEYVRFFKKVLIPLHKPSTLLQYYSELCHCIILIIKKSPDLVEDVLFGLLKYWPKTNSLKEIVFLCEIEEILKVVNSIEPKILAPLFRQIAQCISSPNRRVSHRALALWDNAHFAELILKNVSIILPEIFKAVYEDINHTDDLEQNYSELAHRVRMFFIERTPSTYGICKSEFSQRQK